MFKWLILPSEHWSTFWRWFYSHFELPYVIIPFSQFEHETLAPSLHCSAFGSRYFIYLRQILKVSTLLTRFINEKKPRTTHLCRSESVIKIIFQHEVLHDLVHHRVSDLFREELKGCNRPGKQILKVFFFTSYLIIHVPYRFMLDTVTRSADGQDVSDMSLLWQCDDDIVKPVGGREH